MQPSFNGYPSMVYRGLKQQEEQKQKSAAGRGKEHWEAWVATKVKAAEGAVTVGEGCH